MLFGEKVRLRAMEREDIATFVRWFNDPEVRQYLLMFAPMSKVAEERWFEAQLEKQDQYLFVIEARKDEDEWALIGNVDLSEVDLKNGSAKLGIVLGDKNYWGQGYGSDALRTMLRFAFDELNLHRVELDVYDFNSRARRSYEKVGFQLEGTRRQAVFRDGRYRDVHLLGILREEFLGQ